MAQATIQHAFDLAMQQHRAGRLEVAEHLYQQILAQQPDHADATHFLGVVAHQRGQHNAAIAIIRRAIQLDPTSSAAHCNLGNVLKDQSQLDEAVVSYRSAIALDPGHAESHNNLGNALNEMGQLDAAIAEYRQAIAIRPAYAKALNNLGAALHSLGQPEEAVAACQCAIAVQPDYFEAHCNLGAALFSAARVEDAIEQYRVALALRPDSPKALSNCGAALCSQGQVDEGIAVYRRAISLQPDFAEAHHNLALALLLSGQFAEGWREYEWRWRWKGFTSPRRPFTQPAWDGSPLAGRTILVHAEQGFGDTIQFARYLPLLTARGERVIFECPPELTRLMQRVVGLDPSSVTSRTALDNSALPAFSVHAPLLSLPLLLGLPEPQAVPPPPYIHLEKTVLEAWRQPVGIGSRLKVGLAWACAPEKPSDRKRSIPLRSFAPLLQSGADIYSLQPGEASKQNWPDSGLIDLTGHIADFFDTAGLISHLDLIICVDTAVAHVAGALGKPTWLMVPYAPDWRWQLDREDSPWYPRLKIFRQTRRGEWDDVVRPIAEALRSQLVSVSDDPPCRVR
jgi:tetratricopeptide (TPR) repeat protein